MKIEKSPLSTATAYGLLGAVALTSCLLPDELVPRSASASGPATVRITGTIRDFTSSHPDFGIVPANGYDSIALDRHRLVHRQHVVSGEDLSVVQKKVDRFLCREGPRKEEAEGQGEPDASWSHVYGRRI